MPCRILLSSSSRSNQFTTPSYCRATDPNTGRLKAQKEEEATRCLRQIEALLAEEGMVITWQLNHVYIYVIKWHINIFDACEIVEI